MTVDLFKKCYISHVVHAHLSSIDTMLWCLSAGDTFTFYVLEKFKGATRL